MLVKQLHNERKKKKKTTATTTRSRQPAPAPSPLIQCFFFCNSRDRHTLRQARSPAFNARLHRRVFSHTRPRSTPVSRTRRSDSISAPSTSSPAYPHRRPRRAAHPHAGARHIDLSAPSPKGLQTSCFMRSQRTLVGRNECGNSANATSTGIYCR